MSDPYRLQAIVIPRGYYPTPKQLGVCIAFGVLPPPNASDGTIPAYFEDWPKWIGAALAKAEIEFQSEAGAKQIASFERLPARDLAHARWTDADASRAWKSLYGRFFSGPREPSDAGRPSDPIRELYKNQLPPEFVNPATATDLNPAHRFESPNPIGIGEGIVAQQAVRLRTQLDDDARAKLDERILASVEPAVLQDALGRLAEEMDSRPYRYSADALAAWGGAVRQIAFRNEPVASLNRMNAERRALVVREAVNLILEDQSERGAVEFQRAERQLRSGRNRVRFDAEQEKKRLEDPSFGQAIARTRRYPGLARRLALVVHGVVAIGEKLDPSAVGTVRLKLAADGATLDLPRTKYHFDEKASVFRAAIGDPTFSPNAALFYEHNVFDPALYRVTQQDFLVAAMRNTADETAGSTAAPAADPTAAAVAELTGELERTNVNSIQVLWTPRVGSSAGALDRRLRDTADRKDPALTAEDLAVGWTVFVRRRTGPGNREWLSLCRRIVSVTPKGERRPAFEFEEEGHVATGTMRQAPPTVGLVAATTANSISLNKLYPGNLVAEKKETYPVRMSDDPVKPVPTVVVRSDLEPFSKFADVKTGDVAHLTLNFGADPQGLVDEIELSPRLKQESATSGKGYALLVALGVTEARKNERRILFLDDRTRYLDEFGKSFPGKTLFDKDGKFLEKLFAEKFPEFLVEGDLRLFVRGPKFNVKGEVKLFPPILDTTDKISAADGAVYIHRGVAPGVLQHYHLAKAELRYRSLFFPKPGDSAADPLDAKHLVEVREVLSPLVHTSGHVESVGFAMTGSLTQVEIPTRAFLGFRGKAWQFDFLKLPLSDLWKQNVEISEKTEMTESIGALASAGVVPSWWKRGDSYQMVPPKTGGVAFVAADSVLRELIDAAEVPTVKKLVVRLTGVAEPSRNEQGEAVVVFRVLTADRIGASTDANLDLKKRYSFDWIVRIRPGQNPAVAVRYPGAVDGVVIVEPDYSKVPELIHPFESLGLLVDAIQLGADAATGLGRAWPQAIAGNVEITKPGLEPAFAALQGFRFDRVQSLDAKFGNGFYLVRPVDPAFAAVVGAALHTSPPLGLHSVKQVKSVGDFPVVGEVTERKAVGIGSVDIKLQSLDGGTVTIRDDQDTGGSFLTAGPEQAPRRLLALLAGETVLAFGTPVAGWFQPSPLAGKDSPLRLSAILRGRFARVPTSAASGLRNTGAPLSGAIATPGGKSLAFWVELANEKEFPADGTDVATVGRQLLQVRTLSKWVKPDDTKKTKEPVHLLASDLIARWGGWSLATPMPGESDAPDGDDAKVDGDFAIHCHRNPCDIQLHPDAGEWKLPPLRFGANYEFCLRRVDLAGNHLYDDTPPRAGLLADAIQPLWPLLKKNAMLAVLGSVAASALPQEMFRRADRPFPAPLAFPRDRLIPIWGAPSTGATDAPPECLTLIAAEREATLVLFSDVLGRGVPDAREAGAKLLPASAPVETIFLHGVLDRTDPASIPDVIRCHERYLTDKILGCDQRGESNYFGDPQVESLQFELRPAGGGDVAAATAEPRAIFDKWPRPSPVEVRIEATTRPRAAEVTSELVKRGRLPDGTHAAVAALPPGAEVDLAVLPVVRSPFQPKPFAQDVGQRVRLIHVSNGPWIRPNWIGRTDAELAKPGATPREIRGRIEVDPPTTLTYTLSGYWSELWDEAVNLGWQEAALTIVTVKGVILSVRVAKDSARQPLAGYGYGSEAVAMIAARPGASPPTRPALLAPVVVNGSIAEEIRVLDGGTGFDAGQHIVRIIRRPPLFRIAEARVRGRDRRGALAEIAVTVPGCWYAAPPFVVACDMEGDGYGAVLTAELNGHGGVERIRIECGGAAYSDDVEIRFYTHQHTFAERPVPQTGPTQIAFGPIPNPLPSPADATYQEAFQQPFPDAGTRRIDYFVSLAARHQQYLLPVDPTAAAGPDAPIRRPVPRVSVPLALDTRSTVRPAMPRVAYLGMAFRSRTNPGGKRDNPEYDDYFLHRERGELEVSRKPMIRIYLRRPWNRTGAERIGVVVSPAIQNTTATKGDLIADDPIVVNRAPEYPNIEGRKGALATDVLPAKLRNSVSRWGFDPIWNEVALPPLAMHHFPEALPEAAYEVLPSEPAEPERLASLALHGVEYNGARDQWYADVRLDTTDVGKAAQTHPFVRLNIVTHQAHALPGMQSSDIVACDPFPLPTERTLNVSRSSWTGFRFSFAGHFPAEPKSKTQFPRRRVVVEWQSRDPELPTGVEFLHKPNETLSERNPCLKEFELTWDAATRAYGGEVRLPPEAATKMREGHFALVLLEKEYYRTLSAQPSASGDRAETLNDTPCAVRILTTFTLFM